VLDTLDEMGVAGNTLVILTSDNGGMLNVTGQKAWRAGHRLNGDLQGFKFGAWEGGHRVPFLARWPGIIPAGTTSDQLLNLVDFVATMAAVTGRALEGHGDGITSVDVSPDDRRAVSGSWDKTLRVWDLDTGECLRALEGHSDWVSSVSVSPDGRRVVSGGG